MGVVPPSNARSWDSRLDCGSGNAFDIVRLVLATFVVLEHSYFLVDGNTSRDPLFFLSHGQTHSGRVAVQLFLSLSGFLVTRSLMQCGDIRHFLVKRVARIVPGFLVASALGCVLIAPMYAPNVLRYFEAQDWPIVAASALTLNQVSVSGVFEGNQSNLVHGTLWTIKYEFDCYVILALLAACGFLRQVRRLKTFIVIAIALGAAYFSQLPDVSEQRLTFLISSPHMWPKLFPFFFIGSAFYLYRDFIAKSYLLFFISLFVICLSFKFGGAFVASLICGTYAVLFTSLTVSGELKIFQKRVDLSYGVYLYGWPIQQMVLYYFSAKLDPCELFIIAVLTTYIVAWISWVSVERPCLHAVRSEKCR